MMCEEAISNIARALANNKTVETVDFGNWISTRKLETFLNHYALQQPVRSGLRSVRVGCIAFPEEVQMIIKTINCIQILSGQPIPEYPFHVVKYVEADPDGDDDLWHYIAQKVAEGIYNGSYCKCSCGYY